MGKNNKFALNVIQDKLYTIKLVGNLKNIKIAFKLKIATNVFNNTMYVQSAIQIQLWILSLNLIMLVFTIHKIKQNVQNIFKIVQIVK